MVCAADDECATLISLGHRLIVPAGVGALCLPDSHPLPCIRVARTEVCIARWYASICRALDDRVVVEGLIGLIQLKDLLIWHRSCDYAD